jgi:hypothetical protein
MKKVTIVIALSLALHLPSAVLGQRPDLPVPPGDLIKLHIGGAVRNAGLFRVDPTVTLAGTLDLAGGPSPQGQRDKVWMIRDGEVITTILREATVIGDSLIRAMPLNPDTPRSRSARATPH